MQSQRLCGLDMTRVYLGRSGAPDPTRTPTPSASDAHASVRTGAFVYRVDGASPRFRTSVIRAHKAWVPKNLPEVSVEVAEVAGVDAPRPLVGLLGDRGAGGLRLGEKRVDLLLAPDRVADAELAGASRLERDVGVLGQLCVRVERQDEPAPELEHRNGAGGVDAVTGELRGDHPPRFQPELTVERERLVEIGDGDGDHIDVRFHPLPFRSRVIDQQVRRAVAGLVLLGTARARLPTEVWWRGLAFAPARRVCDRARRPPKTSVAAAMLVAAITIARPRPSTNAACGWEASAAPFGPPSLSAIARASESASRAGPAAESGRCAATLPTWAW